jgi:hypothetical protein
MMQRFSLPDSVITWFDQITGRQSVAAKALATLGDAYGIKILTEQPEVAESLLNNTALKYGAPSTSQLRIAHKLLEAELNIYAHQLIKASQLQRIIACRGLLHQESGVVGVFVCRSGSIYLPLDRPNISKLRHSFHHEFFHCIDYHDDPQKHLDPIWFRLNEPGFDYYGKAHAKPDLPIKHGFISRYSMSEVWEDKAELYAHMILNYTSVETRAEYDSILQNKVARMKGLLRSFSPTYDDAFWSTRRECSLPI